jgi:TatD DNase family protein
MIDTHCHLTFPQLHEQLDAVLERAAAAGVDRLICVGTKAGDSEAARDIAAAHDNIHFTVGVHPHYAAEVDAAQVVDMAKLAEHPKCAALGEMGLDYHYPDPPRDAQAKLLEQQLVGAALFETKLPIVIHCRKATDDVLAILRSSGIAPDRFVFHCFTEPAEDARKVLDAGCMISFTGIATYRNAPEVRESAKLVPADRIMVETDSPYLSPEPHRKVRPNEPRFVVEVAKFLAELRGVGADEFIAQCDANAERFYRLG